MYTVYDYQSRKDLKHDVDMGFDVKLDWREEAWTGRVNLEGPHSPTKTKWFVEGIVHEGKLVRIT